jgi:hypothetical protein
VRKALNDNPVVQIAVLGVLVVVVGFFLMTRVMSKSSDSGSSTTASATTPQSATAPTDGSVTPGATDATASTGAPSTAAPPSPGSSATAGGQAAASSLPSKLVAGPGLPRPVADAYADGKAIVLFVFRNHGIDDTAVRASVEQLRGRSDLAVFVTNAGQIARYARITEGVDVNRVPALIVVRPHRLSHGAPTATVSYGFRGPDSVQQAVRDALYKGPRNLPYYPK